MSYRASVDGYIVLSHGFDDTRRDFILNTLIGIDDELAVNICNDTVEIGYGSIRPQFDEDKWINALNAISPYTLKGELYFIGEDNTEWKYKTSVNDSNRLIWEDYDAVTEYRYSGRLF